MKNLAVTVLVVILVAVLVTYLVSFQVRETEAAMVTTFGKPTAQVTEPGWYFKWPPPTQRVYKYDSRLRFLEAELGETTTSEAVPIIINTYVVWKVAEPLKFYNAVGTIREAEKKLLSQISNAQNTVVGLHGFDEFVNSNPDKIKIALIEREMLEGLKAAVGDEYGIEIEAMGIKQLKISAEVSKDVFERMRAERNRRTEATIAQGKAEAARIRAEADSKKTELLAAAEARAKAIRGKGDAEAAGYYRLLEANGDLAIFLRDIEALEAILKDRTTVVLSTDSYPFRLLKDIPDLQKATNDE